MSQRMRQDEFVQQLRIADPVGYVVPLSCYMGSREVMTFRCYHPSCPLPEGHEFEKTARNILRSPLCPEASKALHRQFFERAKTQKQFKEEVAQLGVIVLGEYKNDRTGVRCKCPSCGREDWYPKPSNMVTALRKGHRQYVCDGCKKNAKLTMEQFTRQVAEANPAIEIISPYVNDSTKVRYRCRRCNYEGANFPSNLKRGEGCRACAARISFPEEFLFWAISHALPDELVVRHDVDAIGEELDIYLPGRHAAIEPGSWDWHFRRQDRVWKDEEKRSLCQERRIRLLTVYYGLPLNLPAPFSDDCVAISQNVSRRMRPSDKSALWQLTDDVLSWLRVEKRLNADELEVVERKARDACTS